MKLYPLKSAPVFKQRIWGGRRLQEVFGKDLPAGEKIGESWEIADLAEGRSTIADGEFQGQTLGEVVHQHKMVITGAKNFPKQFPLLIKFLDAQDVLSVQVHPDPPACRRMGKGEPKTECWYIIAAEPGAVIYKGLKKPLTREQFAKAIENGTVADLLAKVPVKVGECHFLPAGTAHAIGAGLLIAEIQTPSDTTYRVFDWNRLGADGNPRPLHVPEALESIHFDAVGADLPVTTTGRLVDCEYFKIDKCSHARGSHRSLAAGLMRTLVVLSGSGVITAERTDPVLFKAGDCLVIPAAIEGRMAFAEDCEYLTVMLDSRTECP
jgi:mannose-6-phosphate isomerase